MWWRVRAQLAEGTGPVQVRAHPGGGTGAGGGAAAAAAADAPAASAKISTGEISTPAGARQVAERRRPLLSVIGVHPDEGLRY